MSTLKVSVGPSDHIQGDADAGCTLVEYGDYECPHCGRAYPVVKRIQKHFVKRLRFVFRNFPLNEMHPHAESAAESAEFAGARGKFWEMHDLLFDKEAEWSALAPAAFQPWAMQQAASLGMDPAKFQSDFNGKTVADRLQQAIQSTATQPIAPPIMFVNGSSPYTGLADFASLDTVVRMEALTARQFSACPPWVIDPLKQYIATLHTSKGDVVIQLLPDKAPLAVNNFVILARGGWYDGITFYKMLPDFLVMTGDPSETGMGNTGYLFQTEISAGLHFDQAGMVAMDNSGPNTNSGRFFITLSPAEQFYGQYTIFGQVISGMPVLSALTARNPQPGMVLPPGDELINVTIVEK